MQKAHSRILVVDDEPDILNLLEYNLRRAGFQALLAKDGPEAIEAARANRPDLVLLDIMLPDMEGTEVLRRLKSTEATASIPVIMLTAKGEEVDKIVGFELGAEDYITKPFSPRELILRVKAVLKRTAEKPEPVEAPVAFGELTVDLSRHKVTVSSKPVELSSTEFRLLTELMRAKGRVLTRDNLLDRAWGRDCFVIPRTVDTHVRRLRSKLGAAGEYIETVRGVGYRFRED
ncbi:Alkaline phosphatase synthesis transcriptional regulatory protein PhoP [uncultured bacterium]|nr:Alkaline phosphatase synthesis transcriptional regulatory protein PhoP [uncultured bacterium]